MTMHLLPCFYTTTRVRKQKSKPSKSQAYHDAWVNKMTKGQKAEKLSSDRFISEYADTIKADQSKYVSAGMTSGVCAKQDAKIYSGERKLLGIATMHKSNMVPVFADNKQDAVDIAKMRRG